NRIDQFGTSQPNIQRLGTGRIQVEIPGAVNPASVRKLLQGVAKLEFWDVVEVQEIQPALMSINQFLVNEQKANSKKQVPAAQSEESLKDALSTEQTQGDTLSDLEKTLESAADSALQGLDSLQNLNI